MIIEHLYERAHGLRRRDDDNARPRLFDHRNVAMLGELRWCIDRLADTLCIGYDVRNGRYRDNKRKTEFTLQALRNNLQMQEAEESAAESASKHA